MASKVTKVVTLFRVAITNAQMRTTAPTSMATRFGLFCTHELELLGSCVGSDEEKKNAYNKMKKTCGLAQSKIFNYTFVRGWRKHYLVSIKPFDYAFRGRPFISVNI